MKKMGRGSTFVSTPKLMTFLVVWQYDASLPCNCGQAVSEAVILNVAIFQYESAFLFKFHLWWLIRWGFFCRTRCL